MFIDVHIGLALGTLAMARSVHAERSREMMGMGKIRNGTGGRSNESRTEGDVPPRPAGVEHTRRKAFATTA